ncbi:hypothetical protein [Urechidicola vernalis]|uniref:Adhesin domain-containing protein n=1 Tax=Urechidicola vernalis TaxID=3075600 RepID=A0ABU2Y3X0_9FLAO|nr:hypothetical protein [Urechidicola sp. P050]MDT0551950.1 hypothetical protein [Urechidicola sp. P050]
MKTKLYLTVIVSLCITFLMQAQETKIPFNSGVLKLCSSKNFNIKGYDGKEVMIKSLHSSKTSYSFYNKGSNNERVVVRQARSTDLSSTVRAPKSRKEGDSIYVGYFFRTDEAEKSKGLKKLGKKAEAEENGIFLKIEQKGNELIITDDYEDMFVMVSDERYEILIPNTIKLDWDTNGCSSKRQTRFFNSKASELADFKGEVEISSTLNNLQLTDVSGPVTINTIGGNVTAVFDKTMPNKLYSIYSNNGFIDITLPEKSSVAIDASGDDILSDLDFDILSENATHSGQQMKLKLGSGKVKMKLDAGYGNIYLRK